MAGIDGGVRTNLTLGNKDRKLTAEFKDKPMTHGGFIWFKSKTQGKTTKKKKKGKKRNKK